MQNQISETDLILNDDGSVYHLHLRPEHIANQIIVVGDPDRVPLVSKYFDSIEFKIAKREFVTHTGFIGKKRLTVISSGIGTDNVEILMNELDALANIDMNTKKTKAAHKTLEIIRIGTSGTIQADIPVDSVIISESAIGIDGLNDFYEFDQNQAQNQVCGSLKIVLNLNTLPYFTNANQNLVEKFEKLSIDNLYKGVTLTCPGFYAPQARTVKYKHKIKNHLQKLNEFRFEEKRLSNLEMETAGYYLFGEIFGHKMLSISAILANRILNRFSQSADKQIDNLIKMVLGHI